MSAPFSLSIASSVVEKAAVAAHTLSEHEISCQWHEDSNCSLLFHLDAVSGERVGRRARCR